MKLSFTLFVLVFYSSICFSNFPFIKIENMSGDYANEQGRAHAGNAKYDISKVKISHQDIFLNFNKKQKNLIIKDDTTSVELDFDFSFLNIFKAFSFSSFQIDSKTNLFSAGGENLELNITPKKYYLSNYYLETDIRELNIPNNENTTIIDGLILNAGLSIAKIEFSNFHGDVFDEMKIENPSYKDKIDKIKKSGEKLEFPMIIRDVDYFVHRGKFSGKAKIDSYINLWFKIFGEISSNKKNTLIKIKIYNAKLGFFYVKRTILAMVQSMNLEGVTVDGDTILVDLDNVVLGQ